MASSAVNVAIHSELNQVPVSKRYDSQIKISELKERLELVTGANHKTMKLTVCIKDEEQKEMCDNEQTLAHYVADFQVPKDTEIKLIVKDENPSLILTQEGDAPRYVISEDKYVQRPNNARNFIKEMREKRMSGASNGNASATAGGQ